MLRVSQSAGPWKRAAALFLRVMPAPVMAALVMAALAPGQAAREGTARAAASLAQVMAALELGQAARKGTARARVC